MLLERPLSLKLIFHYYNQINRQRDRIIWMCDELPIYFPLFHFTVFVAGLFLFSFFFLLLLFFQHVAFLFSFFLSFRVSLFIFLLLVCSCFFFFLLLSIPAFFFILFVDVVLWCLKLSFTVTRFILSPWKTLLAQAPNRGLLYSHLQHHAAS